MSSLFLLWTLASSAPATATQGAACTELGQISSRAGVGEMVDGGWRLARYGDVVVTSPPLGLEVWRGSSHLTVPIGPSRGA